jgi:hypothetical protein
MRVRITPDLQEIDSAGIVERLPPLFGGRHFLQAVRLRLKGPRLKARRRLAPPQGKGIFAFRCEKDAFDCAGQAGKDGRNA